MKKKLVIKYKMPKMTKESLDSREIETYQYIYGDPRTHLYDYLKKHLGYVSVVRKEIKSSGDYFRYKCSRDDNKRKWLGLSSELYNNVAKEIIDSDDYPLVMLPFLIPNKEVCRDRNKSRHSFIILFNKMTREVERIDIRRYHLDGFKIKNYIKNFPKKFMNEWFPEDVKLTEEIDVTPAFKNKIKIEKNVFAFPIYVICYLNLRKDHVELPSNKLIALMNKLSKKKIREYWMNYVSFMENNKERYDKCINGDVLIPENSRCLKPMSKSLNEKMIIKPLPKCRGNQVIHPILKKCVNPKKVKDINIFEEDIKKVKNLNKKDKFVSFDKDISTIVQLVSFLVSKFNYAGFTMGLNKENKRDLSITWRWNEDSESFVFTLPNNFWEHWNSHMYNPNIRFIISFINLRSKSTKTEAPGIHANALIYDKLTNEMERFDGLGRDAHGSYNVKGLDEKLQETFPDVKYYKPDDYCPHNRIFQSLEVDQIPGKDMKGNCAVWRLWFVHIRLANPHLTRKECVDLAHAKLQDQDSLYKYIKAYQTFMTEILK